uniref:(California timema) hypothetical protein n=1 Tax=Timema californicum TaxID=61474 RepID=A0A7R9JE58_TIMCA|nr:unnamed protein product [Timema californicum]
MLRNAVTRLSMEPTQQPPSLSPTHPLKSDEQKALQMSFIAEHAFERHLKILPKFFGVGKSFTPQGQLNTLKVQGNLPRDKVNFFLGQANPLQDQVYPLQDQSYLLQDEVHPVHDEVHPLQYIVYPFQDQVYPLQDKVYPHQDQVHPLQDIVYPFQDQVYPLQDKVNPSDTLYYMSGQDGRNSGIRKKRSKDLDQYNMEEDAPRRDFGLFGGFASNSSDIRYKGGAKIFGLGFENGADFNPATGEAKFRFKPKFPGLDLPTFRLEF